VQNLAGSGQVTIKETSPFEIADSESGWFWTALYVYSTILSFPFEHDDGQTPVAFIKFVPIFPAVTTEQSTAKDTEFGLRAQTCSSLGMSLHPTPPDFSDGSAVTSAWGETPPVLPDDFLVDWVGPPLAFVDWVGPPLALVDWVGPPLAFVDWVGPPLALVDWVGPPLALVDWVGPPLALVDWVGPPLALVDWVGPPLSLVDEDGISVVATVVLVPPVLDDLVDSGVVLVPSVLDDLVDSGVVLVPPVDVVLPEVVPVPDLVVLVVPVFVDLGSVLVVSGSGVV